MESVLCKQTVGHFDGASWGFGLLCGFVLGVFLMVWALDGGDEDCAELRPEAVRRGHAHYVATTDGYSKWEWLPPCAVQPEGAHTCACVESPKTGE